VVHVVTEGPVGWLGRRWARTAGYPLVSSYCTHFAEYARGYGLGLLERPLWSLLRHFHGASHTTLCPSHATRRVLLDRRFHPPIRIWSRGVDAEGFHPSRRDARVREAMAPGAEVILLYVGRIAPEKRLDLLLEAWPRIRRGASREVALVLVGDGPALPELRRRGVEGVHFTGYRHGAALATSYASADLFLFASDTETFGQVVTEAMASGLPAVVPARGGVVDLVDDQRTGRLFVPGDPASLAEAVLPLVADDVLRKRMSREARREAEKRSWSGVFRDLFETYGEASSTRNPAVTPSRDDGVAAHGTLKMNSSGA
jgi:glycosyltransferase involved in cell wall biosynthesis